MEIVVIHISAIVMYLLLLANILIKRLKPDPYFILAVSLTLFYLCLEVYNNFDSQSYYLNYYSFSLYLIGWLLFLQSTYTKIPESRKTKIYAIATINTLLVVLLAFQLKIDRLSSSLYYDQSTLQFAVLLVSISMLYYLENIIRCLKIDFRYYHKHLLFALSMVAVINLLNFYQVVINGELNYLLHYMVIIVQVFVPFFIFVSINRAEKFNSIHFNFQQINRTQYFLIIMGMALIITAILQLLGYYHSQVRSNLYQAVFILLIMTAAGVLVLSNYFRTELIKVFRAYFYADRNDYKKEWGRVIQITRNELSIEKNISAYFQERLQADQSALYLYQLGRMKLLYSTDELFKDSINDLNRRLNDKTLVAKNVYAKALVDEEFEYEVYITLEVDKDLIGVCWLKFNKDPLGLELSQIQICHTVSTEFAIRLWELRHKKEIQRKDRLMAFNKTVTFLAHDLKNIVAQQQLAYENFNKYRDDAEFLEDFHETIGHSTQRLIKLISQLRYKSLNSDSSSVNFTEIVKFIEQKARLYEGRILFTCENPHDLNPSIDANVLIVIENLLSNAVEASRPDQLVNIISSLNKNLHIDVVDSGKGMDQSFIENELFEPFSTTKKDHGLGVGMYQVKSILDELNGKIDITSKIESGTHISIVIPISDG